MRSLHNQPRQFPQKNGRLPLRYLRILTAAELGANFYSKIRLSLDELPKTSQYFGKLMAWCPRFEDKAFLKYYNIRSPVSSLKVAIPYYRLPFKEAESLETPESLLAYQMYVQLKDYFAVKRFRIALNSNIPSTLVYAHDPEIICEVSELEPRTTRETLRHLSHLIRGFWSLEYTEDQKVKLPAIYGKLLEKDLLNANKPLVFHHRDHVVGSKTSDSVKYLAPRSHILNKDRKTYTHQISNATEQNLRALVKDQSLYRKCKRFHKLFQKKKEAEEDQ